MDDAAGRDERRHEYASLIREAADPATALSILKDGGASPIDAIATLRSRFGMSAGDAKLALHDHPAWYADARAAEALHDELERYLDELPEAPARRGSLTRFTAWLRRR